MAKSRATTMIHWKPQSTRYRHGDSPSGGTGASPLVRCAECLKQVPAERAVKSETEDYVRHFCGLDCLHAWERLRHAS